MISGYSLGNPVYWDNNDRVWRLKETNEINEGEIRDNLICPKCEMKTTSDGHDPCISNLPNVEYACCGHGIIGHDTSYPSYIKFENTNKPTVRFKTTDELLEYVKNI